MNENNNINNEPVLNTETVNPVTPTEVVSEPVMNPQPVVQEPQMVPTEPVIQEPQMAPVVEPVMTNAVVSAPVVPERVMAAPTPVVTEPQMAPVVENAPIAQVAPPVQAPVVDNSTTNVDNNAMVNENLKKVEIKDYTPPSKFKMALLIIFFIALVAFIIFLPDISSMIRNYRSGVNYQKEEVITTGKLVCTLESNTSDLDKNYELVFDFTDSKLKKNKFIITTRGDSTAEKSLDEVAANCDILKEESEGIEGFSIRCEYTDGRLVETQNFNLETIDADELDATFTEAGGMSPSYTYDQDIDGIEKNMKASGYTCERQN